MYKFKKTTASDLLATANTPFPSSSFSRKSKDVYLPTQNGTTGIEDFGEESTGDHRGTYHPETPYLAPEAVEAFLQDVPRAAYREQRYSTSNPRGWEWEETTGFRDRCPTKWAAGALNFSPGWDTKPSIAVAQVSVTNEGEVAPGGSAISSRFVRYGSDGE